MERVKELKKRPPYYMCMQTWKPIMDAYENLEPRYYATPATSYLPALYVGLQEAVPIEQSWQRHEHYAKATRAALAALNLRLIANNPGNVANTMSSGYDATHSIARSSLPHPPRASTCSNRARVATAVWRWPVAWGPSPDTCALLRTQIPA